MSFVLSFPACAIMLIDFVDPRTSRARQRLQLVQAEPETHALLVSRQKADGIRLTDSGALALAVRRNLASIGSQDLGIVCLDRVSGQTVRRAEVSCGTALLAAAHSHFETMTVEMEVESRPEAQIIYMMSTYIHIYI